MVGAGVSGLTTAICLAEAGRRVRVWTAEPPQRTTSVVAGALWGPSFQEPMAKTMAWTEASLGEFTALAAADPDTGVRLAPAVVVGSLPADGELPAQAQMIPELRPCTDEELPPGFESGFHSRMPLMDMPGYLDYLERRLVAAGGEVEQHRVTTLAEAAEVAPVVVNCAGLGAIAGLRPDRPAVRVEAEPLGSGWCVHDYGHGGQRSEPVLGLRTTSGQRCPEAAGASDRLPPGL